MRMLDLFCGEGLASQGYWLSGRFSEIVGIDNNNDKRARYSFDFICADAMSLDYEFLSGFDFIHASPPCQGYSKATPKKYKKNHVRLVAATHLMLFASGKPYVIENVEGSSKELKPNFVVNGQALGLKMNRRRYFHVSTLKSPVRMIKNVPGSNDVHNGASRDVLIECFGLNMISRHAVNKMTVRGILQGIPPIMTKEISSAIFPNKFKIG